MRETRVHSLGREDPLEKEMATHSSILAGKSHRWRNLVGYSPWGCKESDTTERLHFTSLVCVCAKSLQLCLTLCDPMDYSPPGLSVQRIFQARILEWVAISFSWGSS